MRLKKAHDLIILFLGDLEKGAVWAELLDHLKEKGCTSRATLKKNIDQLCKKKFVEKRGRRYILIPDGEKDYDRLLINNSAQQKLGTSLKSRDPYPINWGTFQIVGEVSVTKLKKLTRAIEKEKNPCWICIGDIYSLIGKSTDKPNSAYTFLIPGTEPISVDIWIINNEVRVWTSIGPSLRSLKESLLVKNKDMLRKWLEGIFITIFARFKQLLKETTGLGISGSFD